MIRTAIDHAAARHLRFRPARALRSPGWRLRVTVSGPAARSEPAAYLLVRRRGGAVVGTPVRLRRTGFGRAVVPFDHAGVESVTLTLVNTSTSFDCWSGTRLTCQGVPEYDDRVFAVSARVVKR